MQREKKKTALTDSRYIELFLHKKLIIAMLSSGSNISSSSNRSILFYIHSNSSREGYCSRSGAIPSLFLIFQGTETSNTRLDPVVLVAELDLGVGLGHQR